MRACLLFVCAAMVTAQAAVPEERERVYHREVPDQPGPLATPRHVFGAINEAERYAAFWEQEFRRGVQAWEARQDHASADKRVPKNLVMFLGDGMSIPTLAAARALLGQRLNQTGEESHLSFEDFPTMGLSKTYCVNQQIPDSACTATAYLCGVKSTYGTLGVTAQIKRHDCDATKDQSTHVQSIASWALDAGLDVGIVTTTRITHASPAGSYAHTANRGWESDTNVKTAGHDPATCPDIAQQLIHGETGSRFKVILGGGRREFLHVLTQSEFGSLGRRTDNRDLLLEWEERHTSRNDSWARVWNRETLAKAMEVQPDYLLGLFAHSHLQYKELAPETQPTLSELTEAAIRLLSRNPKGFFLFVEGGRIDHAHHDNMAALALSETIELSEAVAVAQKNLNEEDSLVVVTSDHSHVMTYNGYSPRGSDILGLSNQVDEDNVPYMSLSYANGPGFRSHTNEGKRPDVRIDADFGEVEWMSHVDAPLESETHGGEDVGVFAWGARHALFSGVYEQSRIPRIMAYSACIGDGPHSPACSHASAVKPLATTLLVIATLFALR